jgi:4-hydroxybenzoate polyprenyltransferase
MGPFLFERSTDRSRDRLFQTYDSGVTTVPAQSATLGGSLRLIAADIKLAHSVFALPFAVLAAFIAQVASRLSWQSFAGKMVLILVCMVTARTWAMLVNRLADRDIDAENARTKRRVFASGQLASGRGWGIAFACAAAFIAAASGFWFAYGNWWPVALGVPVLGWIALYSYTKRFTALCHVFLGTSLAIAPLAAALAVWPEAIQTVPTLWWIAGFVVAWVAGFDVVYALQDEGFDKGKGLRSVPAALGSAGARTVSMLLHAAAAAALVMVWRSYEAFGPIFVVGVAAVLGLLVTEHVIVYRGAQRGLAGLNMAFFTLNGVVSCVLGVLGVIDLFA